MRKEIIRVAVVDPSCLLKKELSIFWEHPEEGLLNLLGQSKEKEKMGLFRYVGQVSYLKGEGAAQMGDFWGFGLGKFFHVNKVKGRRLHLFKPKCVLYMWERRPKDWWSERGFKLQSKR